MSEARRVLPIVVDGKAHRVPGVGVWVCSTCHEEIVEASEMRRAEASLRDAASRKVQFTLDAGLCDRIERAARRDRRSLNQEAAFLLERGLDTISAD